LHIFSKLGLVDDVFVELSSNVSMILAAVLIIPKQSAILYKAALPVKDARAMSPASTISYHLLSKIYLPANLKIMHKNAHWIALSHATISQQAV
jgi:hypothetical protein